MESCSLLHPISSVNEDELSIDIPLPSSVCEYPHCVINDNDCKAKSENTVANNVKQKPVLVTDI